MSPNINIIRRQPGWLEPDACERLRGAATQVLATQAIVEIGGYRGKSTGWLAYGSHEGNGAHVYTVDTWDTRPIDTWPDDHPSYVSKYALPEVRQAYEAHLDLAGIRDIVTPICGWSTDVAKTWRTPKVGLLFHDGSHYHDDVLADLKAWLPHMASDATVILHDATNPTCGVLTAAEEAFRRRTSWDWAGREVVPWYLNGTDTQRRGTLTVRRKAKA